MTTWIIIVGVAMLIGNVYLNYKVAEERQRALREFIDRGRHPSVWRKDCCCGKPGTNGVHRTDGPCYVE